MVPVPHRQLEAILKEYSKWDGPQSEDGAGEHLKAGDDLRFEGIDKLFIGHARGTHGQFFGGDEPAPLGLLQVIVDLPAAHAANQIASAHEALTAPSLKRGGR